MSEILIINGTIINATSSQKADVLVKDEKIVTVAPNLSGSIKNAQIIDAKGKYVIPGGIDPHVHMHLSTPAGYSSDDFYSGSVAALAGGTTTILDFVTPHRGQSMIKAYEQRRKESENCLCDYSFHMSPVEWNSRVSDEMTQCVKELGITSFKTYMAYKSTIGIEDEVLMKVMEHSERLGTLVTVHAEDGDKVEELRNQFKKQGQLSPYYHALSRPAEVEVSAVKKVIGMAKKTGARLYIVHVSTEGAAQLIWEVKQQGIPVFGETCPQYLLLDESLLNQPFYESAPYVLSPALRSQAHRDELWNKLADHTFSTIGTDHCPFNLHGQKNQGKDDFTRIPNGAGGVEHRLELLFTYGVLTGKLSLEKWVELTSFGPAQVFNLTNKGQVAPGFDADLVIWNPIRERIISKETHHQQCDSNIYEGYPITGEAEIVILRGKLKWNKNQLDDQTPGNYIFRMIK